MWAFKRQEFEELFPKRIVDHLVAHAPDASQGEVFQRFWDEGYCPLPKPEDLPVIVAVRMSLSFPALLSSIPLYAIDYTVSGSHVARHRFSDGGITSNFPIHFFDAAVPSRPTFGINLVEVPEVYPDQERNVLLPPDNGDDMQAPTVEITSVPEFAKSLLNTLQNWADSMQTRVPGYRGRIVAVNHTKNEGGMNLDMGPTVVSALATRGQYAGKATDDFDFDNHRWLRFRSFLQTLEEIVKPAGPKLTQASVDGVTSYDDLIAYPPSYHSPWSQAAQAGIRKRQSRNGIDVEDLRRNRRRDRTRQRPDRPRRASSPAPATGTAETDFVADAPVKCPAIRQCRRFQPLVYCWAIARSSTPRGGGFRCRFVTNVAASSGRWSELVAATVPDAVRETAGTRAGVPARRR